MSTNETMASPLDIELNLSKIPESNTTKKRERRPNYTPEEKTYLAELVSQYQHIIEDKRTGGIFIKKKREAWRVITIKYNSNCTTGHRETEHLKTLYDNMKQQARKNDGECFTNVTTKLRLFSKHDFLPNKSSDNVTDEDAAKTLQNLREDKASVNETAEVYRPRRIDTDQMDGQVEPLVNPYDSAAVYFRDNINVPGQTTIDPIQFLDVSLPDAHTEPKCDSCTCISLCSCKVNNTSERSSCNASRRSVSVTPPPGNIAHVGPLQKTRKPLSAEGLKRLYFKRKCQNANLERKKILQEISHAQQKHNLEMIILRRALEKS